MREAAERGLFLQEMGANGPFSETKSVKKYTLFINKGERSSRFLIFFLYFCGGITTNTLITLRTDE